MKKILILLCFIYVGVAHSAPRGYNQAQVYGNQPGQHVYDVDIVNEKGNTALCESIINGDVEKYKTLVSLGANTRHPCIKNINKSKYNNFVKKLSGKEVSSGGFLGLSGWTWGLIGLGAAGAGVGVAAMGSGSGKNSDSIKYEYLEQQLSEYPLLSEPEHCASSARLTTPDGEYRWNCSQCQLGYVLENNICVLRQCPYSTTNCDNGYHVGDTCQSGEITYVECVADICPGYNYTDASQCPSGYTSGSYCQYGTVTKYKCDVPITCPYNTTSCASGYHETGKTCQSGETLYKECEPVQCGAHASWQGTGCACELGYKNYTSGVGCELITIDCGVNAFQQGTQCICEIGYENWQSGGCRPASSGCGMNAHQNGNECECDAGYTDWIPSLGCSSRVGTNTDNFTITDSDSHMFPRIDLDPSRNIYIRNTSAADSINIVPLSRTYNNKIISINNDAHVNNICGFKIGDYYQAGDNYYNAFTNSSITGSQIGYIIINNKGEHDTGTQQGAEVYGINIEGTIAFGTQYPIRAGNASGTGAIGIIYIYNSRDNSTIFGIKNSEEMVLNQTLYAYYNATNQATGIVKIVNLAEHTDIIGLYNVANVNSFSGGTGIVDIDNFGNQTVIGSFFTPGFAWSYDSARGAFIPAAHTFDCGIIKITSHGSGQVYGIEDVTTQMVRIESVEMSLYNEGVGNVTGVYGNWIAYFAGRTNIVNYQSGLAIGISAKDLTVAKELNIQNISNGNVIGVEGRGDPTVYLGNSTRSDATNNGDININNIGSGNVIGMLCSGSFNNSTCTNSGSINITREIYTDKYGITYNPSSSNTGTTFGIYVKSGNNAVNSGTINITTNGNAYGIYAESGSTVTNTGTISINGVSCTGSDCDGSSTYNNHIVLNGSTLYNSGVVAAPQMNLNSMGGKVMAGLGSQFVIDNELSGDLNISSELVQNGNQTTYIAENMIDAGDVSGLNVRSASAMFDASLADNGHDVVMQMKDFNELTDNKSLASFLANNYANGNGMELFDTLKSMDNMNAFGGALSGLTGLNTFTQFAHEDLSAMREISLSMNNKLFENSDNDSFDISDSMGYFSFSSDHNGGSGQYGITSSKVSDNWKLGYGMAFANINTVADNNDVGRQNTMWLFYMPAIYNNGDYELVVSPKAGFSYSDYNRRGYNNMNYDGRIEKRIFGLMNDLRYPVKFGNWTIAPDLGFNTIVYTQKGNENGQLFSLVIPEDETVSVETGLGLYAKYDKTFDNGGRLKLTSGLMAYREFGDTYNIKLGITGMDGTFDLYNNDYKYRGAASFGFDYAQGNLHLYGGVQYFMDNANYTNFKGGVRYKF